jgi:hypothetical protein
MSTIINLNNVAANVVDSYLQSVQLAVDAENGSFVTLGGVVANNPDVRTGTAPVDVANDEMVLLASPEIIEVNGLRVDLVDPTLFTNVAGRPARGIRLHTGDTVTMTDDGFTGSSVVGQFVIPVNATLKGAASAVIGTAKISLLVLEKTTISTGRTRKAATKLQVVKS